LEDQARFEVALGVRLFKQEARALSAPAVPGMEAIMGKRVLGKSFSYGLPKDMGEIITLLLA
jgi:hypothetical protein